MRDLVACWALAKQSWLPLFASLGLFLGIFVYFALQLPEISRWIWYAVLVGGGLPIVYQTVKGLFLGRFASDIVAMLAILTAIGLDQAFAGAVVVLMQSGGEAIEAYGFRRATSSLTALLERAPRLARRKRDHQMEEISVQEVRVGDILIVGPGDLIPVDGTVVHGHADIDESALTGEPLPKSKRVGDALLSGSVDLNGALEMRADKLSRDSQYAKIVLLVKKAQEEKAPIQRLADRYAILFTPLTLLMAALGFILTRDSTTILSVLVVATPCPLILATPLAIICGMNRATDAGIIVKGGAPLEQVASVRAALFDKTGTVTFDAPYVESIVSLNGESEEMILFHAASLDQLSSHPVAKSIVKKAQERLKQPLVLPEEFREFPGEGVEGKLNGVLYLVGSRSFVEERTGNSLRTIALPAPRKVLIFVVRDHTFLGCLILTDRIRPEAESVVRTLRTLGVQEVIMLTGDGEQNATLIAKQAGIETVKADLLPEQKVHLIRQYTQLYRSTLMVGDGINDAPALATATVGIAMGASGTAISAEAADIVLLVDDLTKVAESISIGQRTLFIAKQSIWIGMSLSFALMIVAVCGYLIPAIGALLQEIIDVAVILNALRARKA